MLISVQAASSKPVDTAAMYLDLLKRCLTGTVSEDSDFIIGFSHRNRPGLKRRVAGLVGRLLSRAGFELIRKRPYNTLLREVGGDWPPRRVDDRPKTDG